MTKNVHEEAAIGRQPLIDPSKQLAVVAHVFEHFDGNNRSKRLSVVKSFMSQVTTSMFSIARSLARSTIKSRCDVELDTDITDALGKCSAIHSDNEPQPQPRSRTRIPSVMPARRTVSSSAAVSASERPLTSSGQ